MSGFSFDRLIARLRAVAERDDAAVQVREILRETVAAPAAIVENAPYDAERELRFEDRSLSVWQCRFEPGVIVPPHDHQTTATIGVYLGTEENRFYSAVDGALTHRATRRVGPGEVIGIGPRAIHSVSALDGEPSYAIHVYLAALSTIDRSLFDWVSGEAMMFNDENYARLALAAPR